MRETILKILVALMLSLVSGTIGAVITTVSMNNQLDILRQQVQIMEQESTKKG